MANTSVCNDTSEAVELCEAQGLYLKPVARINICAQLPQLKTPGKTISNWEVMERVKQMIRPETFLSIKVVKSTMEFIRLEGEIENKSKLALLIIKLNGKTIKLSGFPESLKVRAAETKTDFPVRHNWDSFFRDARHMNELQPGERPDTIYLKDLPTRWFSKRSAADNSSSSGGSKLRPNEEILSAVFETFGEVRRVDIPMLDPYRKEILGQVEKPGTIQTFNYGQDIQFDAYVQFKEYISFVKAMDALRGMKLMFKDEDKAHTASIKVEFDRTRHLSDRMIRKRQQERDRLQALEELRREQDRLAKEEEERKKEEERLQKLEEEKEKQRKKEERQQLKADRRKERAEKRRLRQLEKKQWEEYAKMKRKIALEERRLLIAQRKLESLRLLSDLFQEVKDDLIKEEAARREAELEEQRQQEMLAEQKRRLEEEQRKAELCLQKKLEMRQQEQQLREKILKNFLAKEQKEKDRQREELRLKLAGSEVRLKSAVVTMKSTTPHTPPAPSSPLHTHTRTHSRTPPPHSTKPSSAEREPSPEQKEEPSSSVKDDEKEERTEKEHREDDGEVEILELPDKDLSIIEILSSSDEGEKQCDDGADTPSPPKKQKTQQKSTLEKVLKSNKLRAWGGASRQPEEESPPYRPSRSRLPMRNRQHIQVQIRRSPNNIINNNNSKRNRKRDLSPSASTKKREAHSTDRRQRERRRNVRVADQKKRDKSETDESDSDSGDSTTMVIPPPRSSFAPPDDPGNFLPSSHMPCPPRWGPHAGGFRSGPRRGHPSRGPRREWSQGRGGGGSGRNFHMFKETYLKKYNKPLQQGDRGYRHHSPRTRSPPRASPSPRPALKSVASSVSYNLSKKRDTDGRFMHPLPS